MVMGPGRAGIDPVQPGGTDAAHRRALGEDQASSGGPGRQVVRCLGTHQDSVHREAEKSGVQKFDQTSLSEA